MVVLVLAYYGYKSANNNSQETRYVLASVQKGTLISSVSGTGQVSVSEQLDIKSKGSGDVLYVASAKQGQFVRAGTLLVQLDATDAQKAVRNAEINLENTQIALSKLQINQNSNMPKIQDSITSAQNSLKQNYQSGFAEVVNDFLDLPTIIDEIRGIIFDTTVAGGGQSNSGAYQNLMDSYNLPSLIVELNQATIDYNSAHDKYTANLADYQNIIGYSDPDKVIALVNETLNTSEAMARAIKDEQNALGSVVSSLKQYQSGRLIPAAITQYQSDISTYTGKLNSHISSLNNISNSITSAQQTLAADQRNLTDTQQSDPLDLANQQNSLKQSQAALADAKQALTYDYITALFDGILANIAVNKNISVSTGTVVATLITSQQIAQTSLNEVDIAKINIGDKVTLSFDAISGLTITGKVIEIDTIGTVSQGVVNYNVKIGFDTQDTRIKPGMSVSANIITDVKADVLTIPNSAVKTVGGVSYVQIVNSSNILPTTAGTANAGVLLSAPTSQQMVVVGSSNDTNSEITNGLNEGDTIVVRTIAASTTTNQTTQTRSLLPTTGSGARAGGGGFGGGARGN